MAKHDRIETRKFTATGTNPALTTLTINVVTADQIILTYNTVPDNRPNTYGNFVAIWQNQNQIPYNQDPLSKQNIPNDTQKGDMAFDGLSVTENDYIIGYAVGPVKTDSQTYGNVCSTAFIPSGAISDPSLIKLFSTSLLLKYVGSNTVSFQYSAPANYQPATNKAWAGLWRGASVPYTTPPDVAAMAVTLNSNFGTLAFNGVSIGIGLTYSIGFFMSGWSDAVPTRNQKTLACWLSFTQGS
jgi:hypothetical protein